MRWQATRNTASPSSSTSRTWSPTPASPPRASTCSPRWTGCWRRARSSSAAPTATGRASARRKARLHEFGVELIDVPPSTRAGKNGADMRLVIDALELCYAREHIDTFVIASGDSDFCPLAYKLRENDRAGDRPGGEGGDLAVLRQGVRRVHLPAKPPGAETSRRRRASRDGRALGAAARKAARGKGGGEQPAQVPADRPRGGGEPARARDRAAEPFAHQGDHRPQGARLRRARARLLHLLAAARGDGEGRACSSASSGRQWYVVPPDAPGPGPEDQPDEAPSEEA